MNTADLKLVELHNNVPLSWCSLFNTYSYFNLHKTASAYYFSLLDAATGTIVSVCHFTETEKGVFVSPYKGTFAGIEVCANSERLLKVFLPGLERELKARGASKLIISCAPAHYNPVFAVMLQNSLLQSGYKIEGDDGFYTMHIDESDISTRMNRNNQRQLKKCMAEGFQFEQAASPAEFKEVYDTIATNRLHKGYFLSMTWEQLMEMHKLFSDRMFFFKVKDQDKIAASAICIKITPAVLYVFYWGDVPGYESFSPVSFIADGIYKFARTSGFKILDLGGTTVNGTPIEGLIKFKESLGFRYSVKYTYSKAI